MRQILRSVMLLLVFSIGVYAMAQSSGSINLGNIDFPIAATDNVFSLYNNPSLLGTGDYTGLGMAYLNIEEQWQKHYWLLLNSDALSYSYERDNGADYHTLATGEEVFPAYILPNVYAGTSYRWMGDTFKEGAFRSGVTYRPLDASSFAFTWDNPYKESPAYRAGLAIRPLSVTDRLADYRIEFTLDMNYCKEIDKYEFQKPTYGVQTQLFDGLKVGAMFNTETESSMLSFSLASSDTEVGGLLRMKENDNYGIAWANLTELSYKPFLGLTPKSWYPMNLSGNILSFKAPKYTFGPFKIYDSKDKSVEKVIAEINKAKSDPQVQGILLRNPSFATSYALQQELIEAFADFKNSGKKVSFYFNNISNAGYGFAASVADNIYLNPQGSVDLHGLAISSPYIKDMLGSLGIEALNFRSHKYKTAGNMFSESEMTAAEREVYDSILQSLYSQMVDRISRGRGQKLSQPVEKLIDGGPYFLAHDALKNGLVDALIYEDQLDNQLKEDYKFSKKVSSLADYRSYDWSKPKEHQIAVIYASGNIVMGKGTPGQKIAHETTVKLIRNARKNKNYKGIILRVDSGGGSAQASDIILRELELAQTENKKPIVVSMAGVAGSGGYYIACKADRIVANPSTITGSIGVVGLLFNATEMFKKIKVNYSTVKKGERADMGSLSRPWTEEEKELLTQTIEWTYEDFVKKVDDGRKTMTLDQVHKYAQGRIWTGEQALDIGLIDDLGGLDVAVRNMQEVSKIKGKLQLVDATTSDNGIRMDMSSSPLRSLLPVRALESISEEYINLYELWEDFAGEKALMLTTETPEQIQF